MSQTPEIRIRLQYRAHRRSSWVYEHGRASLFLSLARQWKRPIREIKLIVRGETMADKPKPDTKPAKPFTNPKSPLKPVTPGGKPPERPVK